VFFLNLHVVGKERKFLMEDFTLEPDYSLRGFKRYSSTDPRFPLSLSYPGDLDVMYNCVQDTSPFVDFGRDPWQISVTRWDRTEERYNLRGDGLYEFIKQDMNKLMRSTQYVSALVNRYSLEWPGQHSSKLGKALFGSAWPENLRGPALVGERAMEVPRAIYESPAHRYGERVYVWRPYDSPSIIWTIWRNAGADLAEDTFKRVLRSLRWL